MVDLFFVNLSNDSSVTPMTKVGVTKQDETREKRVEELPESWRKERERKGERERERRTGGSGGGKIRLITLYAWLSPKWARDYYFPRV